MDITGLVEGFYGTPWTVTQRNRVMEICGAKSMDFYWYGPKDDPKFRDRWREAFSPSELGSLNKMQSDAQAAGMTLGLALSPGLDIDFGSEDDLQHLVQKFRQVQDLGVNWLALFWDDIDINKSRYDPSRFRHAAEAQASVTNRCFAVLREEKPGTHFLFCPTEYWSLDDSPYRTIIKDVLHPDIAVFWTGPKICSETITVADVQGARRQFGHPIVLWDNYPVNDAEMVDELHIGPLEGREPAIMDELYGYLCNPMDRAETSLIALETIGEFVGDPVHYNPPQAWQRALNQWGPRYYGALEALGWATRDSCCGRGSVVQEAFDQAWLPEASGLDALAVSAVQQWVTISLDAFPPSLQPEVAPWVIKLHTLAMALNAALARDSVRALELRRELQGQSARVYCGAVERWLTAQPGGEL